jgi:hypothetical protein
MHLRSLSAGQKECTFADVGDGIGAQRAAMGVVNKDGASIYKYLNFDQIPEYAEAAEATKAC